MFESLYFFLNNLYIRETLSTEVQYLLKAL
jgi:hypothetical protein